MTYASGTNVDPSRSRDEIERALMRYGAESFGYHRDRESASIYFKLEGLPIVLKIPLPSVDDDDIRLTPNSGRPRSTSARDKAYEDEIKRRWRVMLLLVKAKLEAIDLGLARSIDEFGMYVQLTDGRTTADLMVPQLEKAREQGKLAGLLPLFD